MIAQEVSWQKRINEAQNSSSSATGDGPETVITNKGNEIDITPSKNHSTTAENPGLQGEPNSSVDIVDRNGNIVTRRWFDEDGRAIRDVDFTNHGNPKTHPEWPHEHSWDWTQIPPRQ